MQLNWQNILVTDRLFFPLMLCLAVMLVCIAAFRFGEQLPIGSVSGAATDYVTVTINGEQLNRFKAGPKLEKEILSTPEGTILDLKVIAPDFPQSANAGPHFRLAPDLEVAFAERRIRITLRARATSQVDPTALEINYMSSSNTNSGWQNFSLSEEFADYSFEYTPPKSAHNSSVDFLGIRPGVDTVSGDLTAGIQIESLTFHNLGAATE